MIHHNVNLIPLRLYHYKNGERCLPRYGVSAAYRVLSPQLLIKRQSNIWYFLRSILGLTCRQREIVFKLLDYWARYGSVYVKEHQCSEEAWCSKPTFWRTIALLKSLGLITVVNRYVRREKAQISNLYLLDKLIAAIAKYLRERYVKISGAFLNQVFSMTWPSFWRLSFTVMLAPPKPTATT